MNTLKEILEGIEISDEQGKALGDFIDEIANKRCAAVQTQLEEFEAKARKAFALLESDHEKEMKRIDRIHRRAFADLESDAEAAFKMGVTEAKKEFAENMVTALQEMYAESYEKARADLLASPEFAIVEELRKKMTVTTASPEHKATLEELDRLKSEKAHMEEERVRLERENIINALCEGVPDEFKDTVRDFVSKAPTNNEMYGYFETVSKIILAKGTSAIATDDVPAKPEPTKTAPAQPSTAVVEDVIVPEKNNTQPRFRKKTTAPSVVVDEDKTAREAVSVFESETTPSDQQITAHENTDGRFGKGFNHLEQQLLQQFVFPKKR